jgi:hypothetical protein
LELKGAQARIQSDLHWRIPAPPPLGATGVDKPAEKMLAVAGTLKMSADASLNISKQDVAMMDRI